LQIIILYGMVIAGPGSGIAFEPSLAPRHGDLQDLTPILFHGMVICKT
jgi:hypothetical protein